MILISPRNCIFHPKYHHMSLVFVYNILRFKILYLLFFKYPKISFTHNSHKLFINQTYITLIRQLLSLICNNYVTVSMLSVLSWSCTRNVKGPKEAHNTKAQHNVAFSRNDKTLETQMWAITSLEKTVWPYIAKDLCRLNIKDCTQSVRHTNGGAQSAHPESRMTN